MRHANGRTSQREQKDGHKSGQQAATEDVGGAGCRSGSDHGKSVEPTCVRRAPHWRGCTGTCAQAVALGNITRRHWACKV